MKTKDFAINPRFVDQLFEYVYCDLGQRWEDSRTGDHYALYHKLNMARLLRHLLSDGTPLAQLAARNHKFKLLFPVAKIGPAPSNLRPLPAQYNEAAPDLTVLPPGYYVHPYDRSGYLSHRVAVLGDQHLTVNDVIDFLANSYGGVHLVPHLSKADHRHFASWNERLNVFGEGVMFERLDQIVPTVLRSLKPLRKAIVEFRSVESA